MPAALIGIASALAMIPAAAQAEASAAPGWSSGTSGAVAVHRGSPVTVPGLSMGGHRGDGKPWRHGRRHRGPSYPVFIGDYGYYEDNPAWQPDSYNDWWHERPHRSMPGWLSRNENCQRIWWSGGSWRC